MWQIFKLFDIFYENTLNILGVLKLSCLDSGEGGRPKGYLCLPCGWGWRVGVQGLFLAILQMNVNLRNLKNFSGGFKTDPGPSLD